MGNTRKVQWAGIVALVVVILAVMAVIGVQRAGQRAEAAEAHDAYAQQLQTEQVEREAREKAEAEAAAQQSAEAIAQRTEQARNVINGGDDVVISVLGDSTGNDLNEWVRLWAEDLADDGATVTMHRWDAEELTWLDEPFVTGEGARQVTIWNGAHPGASPLIAQENPALFPDQADLLLANYGHNGSSSDVQSGLSFILDTANEKWGEPAVAMVVQNPATGEYEDSSAANQAVVREVSQSRSLPVIDVRAAFEDSGDASALLFDDLHPNEEGSQVWAEAVTGFFG